MILVWVDDIYYAGPDHIIPALLKDQLLQVIDCNKVGDMKDYVDCKIERDCIKRDMRLTQPVKIRKFKDKFGIKDNNN